MGMFEERKVRDSSSVAMLAFRAGIVVFFVLVLGRMYQLQVVRGAEYRTRANENRLVRLETAAPRGVIYDRNDTILVRNRPSFEVALIPEFLPLDDPDTEAADEEAQEIERVLRILRADGATSTSPCAWPS